VFLTWSIHYTAIGLKARDSRALLTRELWDRPIERSMSEPKPATQLLLANPTLPRRCAGPLRLRCLRNSWHRAGQERRDAHRKRRAEFSVQLEHRLRRADDEWGRLRLFPSSRRRRNISRRLITGVSRQLRRRAQWSYDHPSDEAQRHSLDLHRLRVSSARGSCRHRWKVRVRYVDHQVFVRQSLLGWMSNGTR